VTLAELITDLRKRLDDAIEGDDDSTSFWTNEELTTWLNEANLRLAQMLEDIEAIDTQDIVGEQANYDLPSDFLRMVRVTYNSLPLNPIDFMRLAQYESEGSPTTAESGTPGYWYIWNNDVYIYPVPAAALAGGLKLYYYKTPATLENDDDIPDHAPQYHHLLPLYVCHLAFEKDGKITESQNCLARFMEGVSMAEEFLFIGDRQEYGQIFYDGE
jgi:hypothetical protein